jgi:hypothetical protein
MQAIKYYDSTEGQLTVEFSDEGWYVIVGSPFRYDRFFRDTPDFKAFLKRVNANILKAPKTEVPDNDAYTQAPAPLDELSNTQRAARANYPLEDPS